MKKHTARNNVLSNRAIWLWGCIIALVALCAAGSLLYFFGQDPMGSSRLEAINIAGRLAIGTGGAAALLLAARRLRFTELDGTERRITEQQGKATEQLGHENAPVRQAGLINLERLAQDHPEHRQAIVEIICGYLRMPFVPPPRDAIERPTPEYIKKRKTYTGFKSVRTETIPSAVRAQEQEVRLTAQRILETHLQPYVSESGVVTGNPNTKYWPEVDLNLAGATLKNLRLEYCKVRTLNLEGARLRGDYATLRNLDCGRLVLTAAKVDTCIDMSLSEIDEPLFDSATFNGLATMFETRFRAGKFVDVQFKGGLNMRNSVFLQPVSFAGASFRGPYLWMESMRFVGRCPNFEYITVRGRISMDNIEIVRSPEVERPNRKRAEFEEFILCQGYQLAEEETRLLVTAIYSGE